MKILVAYFSATGTTKAVATELANAINADIYEIVPEVPYTNDDLNWRDKSSRSSLEMKDDTSRPVIGSDKVDNMDQYDVIFLGGPIWWYKLSHIINSFLESYDVSGKKIVLFATSGGSGLGNSVEALEESAPGARLVDGAVLKETMKSEELKIFAEKFL